ncbi:MAG: class F sortase [Candidatus Nanopelagicales bacterium]|jgi:hypothetical protein|nr:class F sortase [Candidatus Nanopelagicales bacterium]
MNSRRNAAASLVASLALLVVSLGAWATSRDQGVGTDLEQVTLATASIAAAGDTLPRGGTSESARADAVPAAPLVTDVPIVDATRIEALEEVTPPRRVRIGSRDVSMPIIATGVTPDGQMELPDDPRDIGWYRFGALPGDPRGSAVLGGHVDSQRYGTGPLARLASVQEGARITVTSADGQRLDYTVTSVERITKAALPVDRLFDPHVDHRLVVITCGGRFLPDAGGYEDNIVVIATPAA